MGHLPRVMIGGPVRDREWSIPLWLGGILGLSYPRELLSLVILVNDSQDDTEAACAWWAARARDEGFARAEVIRHDLGTIVDNNARQMDREYSSFARLRDMWVSLRDGEQFLAPIDSDVQVPHFLLQGLVGLADRDGYDLLAAVIDNNWSPAPQHGTNVLVADQDGQSHHSILASYGRQMVTRPCALTGACCVIRADVFDVPGMGYFDAEKTPHPTEDEVFCTRLLAAGKRIGYVPGLRASHWHRPPIETSWLNDAGWWARQTAYAESRLRGLNAVRLREVN